jgi:hypothetical protein
LPPTLNDLRIVQGGCRKPHDKGPDALTQLDDFLNITKPRSAEDKPADVFPQILFLTGDQIYADEVSLALLPQLNAIGNQLLGGALEQLPVFKDPEKALKPGETRELQLQDASLANFPNGLRQELVQKEAEFTSSAAVSHLLSFAEYCAMYLLTLSPVLWPKLSELGTPTSVNAPPVANLAVPTIRNFIADLKPQALIEADCRRREQFCEELKIVKDFAGKMANVRRALANIATYMILDDHEVTDDWNLTLGWSKRVQKSALGHQIVRNALVAYAFFQGWGNDPTSFVEGSGKPNAGFLTLAARAIRGRAEADLTSLDDALGLDALLTPSVRWDYRLLNLAWPYGFLVLDERTHRRFFLGSEIAPPARIDPADMSKQIPPAEPPTASSPPEDALRVAGRDVLFVVAPAPVLGVPVVEELIQAGAGRAGKGATVDLEPWSQDPVAFETLLELLAPARRVVFLSGDVHFGHGAAMTYWTTTEATPIRFVQFTASALKNSPETWLQDLLRSLGFGQRILRARAPASRLGWRKRDPLPLRFTDDSPFLSAFSLAVRARLRQEPVLLPGQVWTPVTLPGETPKTVAFARPPDWVWSLKLLFDERPEEDREDRPHLPSDVVSSLSGDGSVTFASLPHIARYHIEAMKTRGMSRQTLFTHNLGIVSISNASGLKATHTLYAPLKRDEEKIEIVTIHEAELDPPAGEVMPGLQP